MDELRLLIFLKKLGLLFVRRKLLVGRKYGLRRRYPHSYLELCVGLSFHRTHCGWNIRIIMVAATL